MSSLNRRLKTYEVKVQCYDDIDIDNIQKIDNSNDEKSGKMECSIASPSLSPPENTASVDERKFTKLAIIIVGLFILCWMPISILYIISYTDKMYHVGSQTSLYVGSLLQLLCAFNSVLNPLVYLGTFRKTLAKTCFMRARYDVTSTSNNNKDGSDDTKKNKEACIRTPLRKQTQSEEFDDNDFGDGCDEDSRFEQRKVFEVYY